MFGLYLDMYLCFDIVEKLFMNGRNQAVRLPAVYRFDFDEVFIRKDTETGDVALSRNLSD